MNSKSILIALIGLFLCCAAQKNQVKSKNNPDKKLVELKRELQCAPDSLYTYILAKIDALTKACEYSDYTNLRNNNFLYLYDPMVSIDAPWKGRRYRRNNSMFSCIIVNKCALVDVVIDF